MQHVTMRNSWLSIGKWLLSATLLLAAGLSQAQVAYGISRTQTYIINPNTGVATTPRRGRQLRGSAGLRVVGHGG